MTCGAPRRALTTQSSGSGWMVASLWTVKVLVDGYTTRTPPLLAWVDGWITDLS